MENFCNCIKDQISSSEVTNCQLAAATRQTIQHGQGDGTWVQVASSPGSRIGRKRQRGGAKGKRRRTRAWSLLFCGLYASLRSHRHNDYFFCFLLRCCYYNNTSCTGTQEHEMATSTQCCRHVCRLCNLTVDSRRAI